MEAVVEYKTVGATVRITREASGCGAVLWYIDTIK